MRSVEVEQVASAQLTVDHLPLLVQPAPRGVVPPLKHKVVALKPACQIIPGRCDEGIFPLQILDGLVGGSLKQVTSKLPHDI